MCILYVYFEWDKKKNINNFTKHGISFDTAKLIFDNKYYTLSVNQNNEDRFISIGTVDDKIIIITVIPTDRNGSWRIISARPASKR